MSSLPASTTTPAPSAQHSRRRFARIFSHPLRALKALKAKFESVSFLRSPSTIGVGSRGLHFLAVESPSREADSGSSTAPSPNPVQPALSSFSPPSAPALSSPPPSPSSSLSLQAPSRASSPTPRRTVKHWPWRPNVYARLKIQGHILPVKLAEVTSTPPPDRPFHYDKDNARFWACVYIDELDYCWWAFTTAIILLDEILRHPLHENVLAPATAEIKSLVNDLRTLRDAVTSDENYGGSRLWLPLSSGETLDQAISTTHLCWSHYDSGSFQQVLRYSRNPGFFYNGLNLRIGFAYNLCKVLHASSELLYFGALPEEPMSRVGAYIRSGGRAFDTESKDLRFFGGMLELLMAQQGCHQYESPTLDRALSSRLVHDIVGKGAYGQIFKVPHPYWGDLAVKELLPGRVTKEDECKERFTHFDIDGHPHILPVVAATSQTIVAMQWAENGCMDKFLARNPDSSRVLLLVTIATALWRLHLSNRLHGDLHMGNIVISKDGEAFLCDFGLSKKVDDNSTVDDPAGGTVSGGVPIYTAPELYEPGARRTFASEVFAFGMVIFQAYSGTRPFVLTAKNEVARHDAAIIKAIVNGTRPTRDQVTRDDFSDEMWNLVQECWNQDPARRPGMDQVVKRMIPVVPRQEKITFLKRVTPIELTLFRPGDVALDDAMGMHEQSAQLQWTLSRMEHFGLKKFFTDHIDARDDILLTIVDALLLSQAIDVEEFDLGVLLRLCKITPFPDSDLPD